jgi:hypothetical protein
MRLLTTFLMLLLSYTIHAQVIEENPAPNAQETSYGTQHRVGLGIGGASAMGRFAEKDLSDPEAGFANGGLTFQLKYEYVLNEKTHITFNWGGAAYVFDAQALAEELATGVPVGTYIEVESAPYSVGNLSFGAKFFTTTNSSTTRFYINPFIGLATMIAPEITLRAVSPNGASSIETHIEESEPAGAFNFGAEAGIEFRLSELINLDLFLRLEGAKFEIDANYSELQNDNGNTMRSSGKDTYDQPYSAASYGINLGFNF